MPLFRPPPNGIVVTVDVSWPPDVQASLVAVAIHCVGDDLPSLVDVFSARGGAGPHRYTMSAGDWDVAVDVFAGERLESSSRSRWSMERSAMEQCEH